MSKKTRNILITILLCVVGIGLIGYGVYTSTNTVVDVVEEVKPTFEDSGVDYNGNKWRLEAHDNENGKYALLEVYMPEDHDMKWYGSVASGPAEINYIIYQNDHYVMSINPNLADGDSELGFIFDKLEPNHSETATYLYYGVSILNEEDGTVYHVVGGELTDEVTDIRSENSGSNSLELTPTEPVQNSEEVDSDGPDTEQTEEESEQ